ncbi:MAG: diphthamide biosynthesis enzyme Dph2 [Nitrososphaerales archaeon]
MFKIDEEKIFSEIESRNPKAVVLNSASGIVRLTQDLALRINEKYSIPAIVIGEPSYGVCDTVDQDAARLGADIAFHIGHTVSIGRMGTRTILVDAFDDVSFDKVLKIALRTLKSYSSIGLCTDSQYLYALPKAKSFLEKAGLRAVIGKGKGLLTEGQVFGCEFYPAFDIREEVDAFVFLGQSRFHSLGIALSTSKPTYMLDPYFQSVVDMKGDADKLYKKSVFAVYQALDSERFAVIVNLKEGQMDLKRAKEFESKLKKRGKKVSLLAMREITNDKLNQFKDVEAFIQTACPRISVDDHFDRPILSVPQADALIDLMDGKKVDALLERRHWL